MKRLLQIILLVLFLSNSFLSFSQNGTALNFDGINDYISIPNSSLLKPSNAITIEAWIRPVDIHTDTNYVIYCKDDSSTHHLFAFKSNGTILSFGLRIEGIYSELRVPVVPSDYEEQWVHIAASYDGLTERVYRDGLLIGTKSISGLIETTGTAPALIGSFNRVSQFFKGSIDELRLWSRALTICELQKHMNCELSLPRESLIAYYKFNQGTAGGTNTGIDTLQDAGANNFKGVLTNFSLLGMYSNWIAPGGVVSGNTCQSASVSISITKGANPLCGGTPLTFFAAPSNAGSNFSFEWTRNGSNISGANSAKYSSNTLNDKDTIRCILYSADSCGTTSSVISNYIVLQVNQIATPSVLISSNYYGPTCTNDTIGFAAFAIRGGTNPAYQWTKNGVDIPGATDSTFITSTLIDNDTIRCRIVSNAACLSTTIATSKPEIIRVAPVYTFKGNGNWNEPGNWSNNSIAPLLIPPCSQVIIDPISNGECVLDNSLLIADGAVFKVQPGKKITIKGNLVIGGDTTIQYNTNDTLGLGGVPPTLAEFRKIPLIDTTDLSSRAAFSRVASLPLRNSLDMPPIQDQLGNNSCTAWSVAYATMGYFSSNKLERNKNLNDSTDYSGKDKKISPGFIWNQLNDEENKGVKIFRALDQIKYSGYCKWAEMEGKGLRSASIHPPKSVFDNAEFYRDTAFNYRTWPVFDIFIIKNWLFNKGPIPFSAWIENNSFKACKGINIIEELSGEKRTIFRDYPSSGKLDFECHAMVLCGWDDNIHAFKVMNSWGTIKGNNGFYWIDYDFLKKMVVKNGAYGTHPDIYYVFTERANIDLTTKPVTNITSATATSGCIVASNAGTIINEKGICYSTQHNPTTAWDTNDSTAVENGGATIINGLAPNTTYYVRAYAKIKDRGIVYGNEASFTTSDFNADQGLVAYYPFNGNANDESGNELNGIVNGALLTSDKNGDSNQAYQFDGIDDYIEIMSNPKLENLTNITISAWVYANSFSISNNKYIPILEKSNTTANGQYVLGLQSGYNPVIFGSLNGSYLYSNYKGSNLNQWYHVVFVHNGTSGYFYINGVKYDVSFSSINAFNSSLPLRLGQNPAGDNEVLNGKLDNIRIYNRVLQENEILVLYENYK